MMNPKTWLVPNEKTPLPEDASEQGELIMDSPYPSLAEPNPAPDPPLPPDPSPFPGPPTDSFRAAAYDSRGDRGEERTRALYEHVLGLHVSYHYQDVWVEYDLGGSTFAITTMDMGHTPGTKGAVVAFNETHSSYDS